MLRAMTNEIDSPRRLSMKTAKNGIAKFEAKVQEKRN
jgi:hypothetical protein